MKQSTTQFPSTTGPESGWVFYDGYCTICRRWVRRLGPIMKGRGFGLMPLQRQWVAELLGIDPHEAPDEMVVLTSDGRRLGGARGIVHLASRIWWAIPIALLARLPGGFRLLDRLYRWIAAHRQCTKAGCRLPHAPAKPKAEPRGHA